MADLFNQLTANASNLFKQNFLFMKLRVQEFLMRFPPVIKAKEISPEVFSREE